MSALNVNCDDLILQGENKLQIEKNALLKDGLPNFAIYVK